MILHVTLFVNIKKFLCFIKLVAPDDVKLPLTSKNYNVQPWLYTSHLEILSIKIITLLKFTFLIFRGHLVISVHQMTPFLGISFTIIICFRWSNFVVLANKLAKAGRFDLILGHLKSLGQKCVTIKIRNLKYDMIRRFPLIIG